MRAEEVTCLPDKSQGIIHGGDGGPTPEVRITHVLLLEPPLRLPWIRGTSREGPDCSAPETTQPSQIRLRRDGVPASPDPEEGGDRGCT